MANDITDRISEEDLHALRDAARELSKTLRAFGQARLAEIGEEIAEDTGMLAGQGRRALHDIEARLAHLEKRVERAVREHPGAWATGVLGVIGFGLVLGLVLRRHGE